MEFDPEAAPAAKKRAVKSVELPTVTNSATVETAKAETAKAETAKVETAKAETAKDGAEATVAIIDEPADPLDFDFADDPKPAAKTEPAAKAPETDDTALKAVTVDDIRVLAIKAAKAGKMAAVTTYLKAAGVPKVQDLDPSKFVDFMTAMKKAGV